MNQVTVALNIIRSDSEARTILRLYHESKSKMGKLPAGNYIELENEGIIKNYGEYHKFTFLGERLAKEYEKLFTK